MAADPIASLRALAGLGTNVANSRGALRNAQTTERSGAGIGASGAFQQMVDRENEVERRSLAQDPMSQKYKAIGEGQAEADVYNEPTIAGMRQDQEATSLARLLAPKRMEGEFGLEERRIANEGQIGAARELSGRGELTRDAAMQRAQVSQGGQMQRQHNAQLETQAKAAAASSRSPWEWLTGKPSPAAQASTLRGQQSYGAPGAQATQDDSDPFSLAEQIRQAYPGQSFQQLISSGAVDVSDASPAEIQALLAAE